MIGFLLLILCFTSLFVFFSKGNSLRIAFVKSILSFTLFQLLITELFSIFNLIDFYSYLIIYICFLLILLLILFKKRNFKFFLKFNIFRFVKRSPRIYKIIFGLLFLNFAIIIFVSLFYPPNNWDANTCWLARVEHWISNKTLRFYPTQINLQNVHQPLSSIIFLNIRLLTKTNLFLNLTQLIFVIAISCILPELLKNYLRRLKYQIVNIVIVFSIPLLILQASSSKNDLVVSFFFISSFYFLIKVIESTKFVDIIWFSISLALAVLTKFSIIPFLTVFITYYFIKLLAINYRKAISVFFTSSVIVLCLASPYLIRNYKGCGNILGNVQVNDLRDFQTEMRGVSQSKFLFRSASVIIKYVGYELSGPIPFINRNIEKAVIKFDSFLNVKEQDVLHSKFDLENANQYNEDSKNSLLLFILILLSIPLIFKQKNLILKEILLLSVVSFFLFSFIFPIYDIYRGRYLLSLQLLLSVPVTYFVVTKFNKYLLLFCLIILLINGIFVSFKNHLRPFPPIKELVQLYKSFIKHIPGHFSYKEDFYNFYNSANSEEKSVIDRIYDKYGTKLGKNITPEDNISCYNYLVKYNVISTNYAAFRKSHLSFNIRDVEFNKMIDYIKKNRICKIGLYVNIDFQEYSLWSALDANEAGIKIEAVNVDNHYKYHEDLNFTPQIIIVFGRPDYYKYLNEYVEIKSFGNIVLLNHQ